MCMISCVQLSVTPVDCSPPVSSATPGENPGVGFHFLLQQIFPAQGLRSHLLRRLHCQADPLPLSHLCIQQVLISYLFYIQQWVDVSPKLPIHPTPTFSPLVSIHLASKFSLVLESFFRYSVLYHGHICLVIFQHYVASPVEGLLYGSILDKATLFSLSSLLFFSKIFLAVFACLFRRTWG